MKKRSRGLAHAVCLCCLIALVAGAAAAADETPRTYGFKAGYWIPGEELFREVLGSGISLGAAYSLPLRPNRWLDFEVLYWSGEGDFEPQIDELGGKTFRTSRVLLLPLALSLRAEAEPLRGIQPFVLGGIDLNIVKEEVDIVQTQDGPDTGGTNSLSNAFLGVHLGAGAQYKVSPRVITYLEARMSISNADTEDVDGIIGNSVSLGGLGIFAGVRIK
jgi:opacity protein-like surface antigen